MTRAEQRRAEREKARAEKTYTLTQAQLDAIRNTERMDALKRLKEAKTGMYRDLSELMFKLLLCIPVTVIHDKWDRLTEADVKDRAFTFAEELCNVYYGFQEGNVTLEELQECLEEEAGITFVDGRIQTERRKYA